MILRDATAADAAALESFDLGGEPSVWLDEVAEIVSGLLGWQHDEDSANLDRRVASACRTLCSTRRISALATCLSAKWFVRSPSAQTPGTLVADVSSVIT